jgi:adenylylsulfate kinase
MVKLFLGAGIIVLTAFIFPDRNDRERVRSLVRVDDFIEIYCRCPLGACEDRDVKGLYQQARSGKLMEFKGISSPYEAPEKPELVLDTNIWPLDECASRVIALMSQRGIIYNDFPHAPTPSMCNGT